MSAKLSWVFTSSRLYTSEYSQFQGYINIALKMWILMKSFTYNILKIMLKLPYLFAMIHDRYIFYEYIFVYSLQFWLGFFHRYLFNVQWIFVSNVTNIQILKVKFASYFYCFTRNGYIVNFRFKKRPSCAKQKCLT